MPFSLPDLHWVRLWNKLNIEGSHPVYVDVIPEPGAQAAYCFQNVSEKISRDGGSAVLGWACWKSDYVIEAEFHCIWRSPEMRLIDITPNDCAQVLFVADPAREYREQRVDNIRINISTNSIVDDMIALAKAIFKLLSAGEYGSIDMVKLPSKDALKLDYFMDFQENVQGMVSRHENSHSLCFCASGREYRYCHGKEIPGIKKYQPLMG